MISWNVITLHSRIPKFVCVNVCDWPRCENQKRDGDFTAREHPEAESNTLGGVTCEQNFVAMRSLISDKRIA